MDLTLPLVPAVPHGRLTVGKVVYKLLKKDLDAGGFGCAAGDGVPKTRNRSVVSPSSPSAEASISIYCRWKTVVAPAKVGLRVGRGIDAHTSV